jgi:hypothetical protein
MKTASRQPDQRRETRTSRASIGPGELELPTFEASRKDDDLVTQRDDLGFQGGLRPEQVTKDADQQPQRRAAAFLTGRGKVKDCRADVVFGKDNLAVDRVSSELFSEAG